MGVEHLHRDTDFTQYQDSSLRKEDLDSVESVGHPDGTHLCGLNSFKKIVCRDKTETKCQNRPFG
jgi:hypothetical protein